MRVSVCTQVTYSYEVNVPDEVDLELFADNADPVYSDIVEMLIENHLNYEGQTVSIVDAETDEVYYCAE